MICIFVDNLLLLMNALSSSQFIKAFVDNIEIIDGIEVTPSLVLERYSLDDYRLVLVGVDDSYFKGSPDSVIELLYFLQSEYYLNLI